MSIIISDLAHSAALDKRAMTAVRGGFGPNVNVNVNLDQKFGQFQQIGVNVLNGNGIIGAAGFGPDVNEAAAFWAQSHAGF